jgi:signal transduction histidine kinase
MTKILLVDDREDNLLSIEAILAPAGYQFVKANSGRRALKILLAEYDFALILMDVNMPNLNGFETAGLIYEREKLRNIPIIFITAHGHDEENAFKGYRTGAVDYIFKPINPELLRAKVSVFIELYRKNQQLLVQEQKLISINKSLQNEINERRLSEEKVRGLNLQLLQNIDKLEAANKDLDHFAFMASHDLQEPLRKIHIFSDRLFTQFENTLDDNAKNYIMRIQSASLRLQALITAIMTFSKISVEKVHFSRQNMNTLLNEVVTEMEDVIREKNAKVTIANLPNLPVNSMLIKTLFHNLIGNALKYSKKDVEPTVYIHSEYDPDEVNKENNGEAKNKYCRIFVEDNGIGFDQKYAEQIFEMFKRLHHHNEYAGTGIGLALCKKIAEQHEGYISAWSEPGKGSTFIVSLPVSSSKNSEKKMLTSAS